MPWRLCAFARRHILRRAEFDAAYERATSGDCSAVRELLLRVQDPFYQPAGRMPGPPCARARRQF